MKFVLTFSAKAIKVLHKLESDNSLMKRLKAVHKTLVYLQVNPKHPSLHTHKFDDIHP